MVVSVLLKINFGHAQISVPKIGIPMSKTACINPWPLSRYLPEFENKTVEPILYPISYYVDPQHV